MHHHPSDHRGADRHRFAHRDRWLTSDQHALRRAVRDHRGHHPWEFLGLFFPSWHVVVKPMHELPVGQLGVTKWDLGEVWIADGQTVAERRSTIAHETGHLLRGPCASWRRFYEEALVDRQAARLLIPRVNKIVHALAWTGANYKRAADLLWTDETLLNVRLSTMAPKERSYFEEQLATVLVDYPG